MHTENRIFDHRCQTKEVEDISAVSPDINGAILS